MKRPFTGKIYHLKSSRRTTCQVDLNKIGPVQHVLFVNKQTFWVKYDHQDAEVPITVWFGPDDHFEHWAGLDSLDRAPYIFAKVTRLFVSEEATGDHLFVDRISIISDNPLAAILSCSRLRRHRQELHRTSSTSNA